MVYVPAFMADVSVKLALAAFAATVPEVTVPITVAPLLMVKRTVPVLTVPLLGVTVACSITEVAPYVALAALAVVVVGGVGDTFPTAKSLNAVKPVPVAVMAVDEPLAGADHKPPEYLRTRRAPDVVTVPASRSPAMNVNATL
jgi:hypothetical protein